MIVEEQLADFLNRTLPSFRKDKFTDISTEYTHHLVMGYLLTAKGGMKVKKSGAGVKETLMVTSGGESEWVGEYDEVSTTVIDLLEDMTVYFRLLHDNLAYTKTELLGNRGESRIGDVILPRRVALYNRIAKTMEDTFYVTPNAEDKQVPWGLKYWVVKNATAGFTGGYPTGFNTMAGVSLTDAPTFKNYSDTYSNITKDDLVLKMRRAHRRTKWTLPKKMKGVEGEQSDRFMILTNEDVCEGIENIGEGQNQNLGKDVSPFNAGRGLRVTPDGEIVFKKKPVYHAEPLDADTGDPVYGLDLASFHTLTRAGDNMHLNAFRQLEKQPRVFRADLYHAHQTICTNRRVNWVIYKT